MIGAFVEIGPTGLVHSKPVGYIVCEGGCWEWVGPQNGAGYGVVFERNASGGKTKRYAHRYVFELNRVPLGESHVDHLCANKICVRPDHLEAVSLQENTRRYRAKITTCVRGHTFSGLDSRGHRTCVECLRMHWRKVDWRSKYHKMVSDPEQRARVNRTARERYHKRKALGSR